MQRWKWFTDVESKGLVDDLMFKLDRMRGLLRRFIRITDGFCMKPHHLPNSAHSTGHAADCTIRAEDDKRPFTDEEKAEIAWAAGAAGFRRIGIYDRHFHVDVDKTKPQDTVWTGASK